jgi:hypothetical protein
MPSLKNANLHVSRQALGKNYISIVPKGGREEKQEKKIKK